MMELFWRMNLEMVVMEESSGPNSVSASKVVVERKLARYHYKRYDVGVGWLMNVLG